MTLRRAVLTAAIGTTGLAAVHVSPTIALLPAGRRIFPVLTRIPGARGVALTFDDGPDSLTGQVLTTLDRFGATATFFVLGEQVERFPSLVREMIAAGHEVGVHGYRHRHHLLLTPGQVTDDLARAQTTIEDAIGKRTTLYRAPHGIFSLASWHEAGRHGWRRLLWSRWGKDWRAGATPESILDLVGRPEAGDIVLLHDSDRYSSPGRTATMLVSLPRILERVAESGLAARSVGTLI